MTVESTEVSVMPLTDAGFVEMRSLLSDGRAMAVADAVRRADAREVEACRRQNSALVPLRWNDRAVSLVLTDSSAMARVRAVTGDGDLRWVSAYVSIKESDSGPTPWHQDWWCWNNAISHAACAPQVALVCFLDDVHGRRAALRVLPKSHRQRCDLHDALLDTEADLPDGHPLLADHPDQVTVPASAGDAVLIDYRLLHGTHPNISGTARSCLIMNFAPRWRTLPTSVRSHLIQGWALPLGHERGHVSPEMNAWIPTFEGPRRTLPLRRIPSPRNDAWGAS